MPAKTLSRQAPPDDYEALETLWGQVPPAEPIPFEDILDAVEVEQDELADAPWEDSDGWDHKVHSAESWERVGADVEEMRGHFHDRGLKLVVLDPKTEEEIDSYGYWHARGASKQVARELSALNRRQSLDWLAKWRESGWEVFWVHGEFLGFTASLGGVEDYEYARKEVVPEIAEEIAGRLEEAGYAIDRAEFEAAERKRYLEARRKRFAEGVHAHDWKE